MVSKIFRGLEDNAFVVGQFIARYCFFRCVVPCQNTEI